MPQDFAKKKPRGKPAPPPQSGWRWFLGGFISGAFLAFLASLWLLMPPEPNPGTADIPGPATGGEQPQEEMQWHFFDIFPNMEVPVVEEYAGPDAQVPGEDYQWVLQAGSFNNPDAADQRRASLILLGLNVQTQKVQVSGDTRYRIIVGPFDSALERNRAQDKLAQAQIKSESRKIPKT